MHQQGLGHHLHSATLWSMPGPHQVDIAAVLAAAYRRPDTALDQVAVRVRARLALMETLGECFRLLSEAPLHAVTTSLPTPGPSAAGPEGEINE